MQGFAEGSLCKEAGVRAPLEAVDCAVAVADLTCTLPGSRPTTGG